MAHIRVDGEILRFGRWVRLSPVQWRIEPWEVVERHPDGSATVVDPDADGQPADSVAEPDDPAPEPITGPAPVHDIVYVKGPLNRRYRCRGCSWVGADPARHP